MTVLRGPREAGRALARRLIHVRRVWIASGAVPLLSLTGFLLVGIPSNPLDAREPEPAGSASLVGRGERLFTLKGCVGCHGPAGAGGVPNGNYARDTVPALNTLARTMFLFSPEDVRFVVEQLERRVPLESVADNAPVRRFSVVLAQYESVRDVIRRGSGPVAKKDPNGPATALEMPGWASQLPDGDIDAIVAYLLMLQPVEAAEKTAATR